MTSKFIQGVIDKLGLRQVNELGWVCVNPFCCIGLKGQPPKYCPECGMRDPLQVMGESLYSPDMTELIRWKPDEVSLRQALEEN